MTGLEIELGKHVIKVATEVANEYIKKAQQYKEQDIRSFENYLEAARVAITGLEEEYDQILVQAKNCELDKPEQIKALNERIDAYLKVDSLRPKLQDSIVGLTKCREALQKNAEGFFLWFWPQVREKRQEALAEFDKLLVDLEKYLRALDEEGLKYRKAGTGVGVATLGEIQFYLGSRLQVDGNPYGLALLVSQFERDPSKDHLMDYIKRIRETIHDIRNAFR
jgi:hypothetical protein